MKILLATHNANKKEELTQMLVGHELFTLSDIDFNQEIEETGATFQANAKIKVEALKSHWDFAILSDDSGLAVNALNGAPGVYSKRYAGTGVATDNNAKLLRELEGITNRSAAFITVFCFYDQKENHFFEGKVAGQIIHETKGNKGFGYDPLFVPDGYETTFAELGSNVKNQISHRARAVQKLIEFINNQ